MKPSTVDKDRQREIRLIKIGQRELQLDDSTYRDMLQRLGGARSATALDAAGRRKVLDHMRATGFRRVHPKAPRKLERSALMQKIEAQLADVSRPWLYAHSMAKRMFGVDHLDFCTPEQLHKIVAALEYDARRRAKAESDAAAAKQLNEVI